MTDFRSGDRVRFRKDIAGDLVQPFRRFAESGREGTVQHIMGTSLPPERRTVMVVFDVARNRKGTSQHSDDIPPNYLERVDQK